VQIEQVYPDEKNPAAEFSFEELRARNRGWFDPEWISKMETEKAQRAAHQVNSRLSQTRQILGARNVQPQTLPAQLVPVGD